MYKPRAVGQSLRSDPPGSERRTLHGCAGTRRKTLVRPRIPRLIRHTAHGAVIGARALCLKLLPQAPIGNRDGIRRSRAVGREQGITLAKRPGR